jgi:hypothetical protein
MKKILLTIGLAAVAALSSQAQGYVLFSSSTQNMSTNNTAGSQQAAGNAATGKTLGAGLFYYALFVSSTGAGAGAQQGFSSGNSSTYVFNEAQWVLDTDPTAAGASTATAGRFAATNPNTSDSSSTVPGITGGNPYYFQVVGWSANLGTTLGQAIIALTTPGQSGYIGQSAISGQITVGNGGTISAPLFFGGGAPNIQAFTLGSFVATPEPGTLALAALGGASMLLFRRKK